MKRRNFINTTGLAGMGLLASKSSYNKFLFKNQSSQAVTFNPRDNGKALVNPSMGWTMHFYSNNVRNYGSQLEPSDTLEDFPGLSTAYLRIPWSYIEFEENKFNWEVLDTPAQRFIDKGKRVAFRITAQESGIRFATPEWVQKAGAKGYYWGKDNTLWEPDFNDPVFLQKVENFIETMAARYDGNPNVDFVDIGHYGLWGEGHTAHSTKIVYGLDVIAKHIDIYCKYFKNTLLCISDDFVGHDAPGNSFPISNYALSKGVTIRDDSILVQNFGLPMPSWEQTAKPMPWFHADLAQLFWPSLPVILEHEHYGSSLKRNAWDKELFYKSIEDYHASYMSIHWWPREFLEANADVIDRINKRMGYRIQLNSLEYPGDVKLGQAFTITSKWSNAGVAPCYPGGFPCFTLKDSKGGIVSVMVDDGLDVRYLPVAAPGMAQSLTHNSNLTIAPSFNDPNRINFRNALPGVYNLYVSVGKLDGTPVLELPYDGSDGHKRYKMGTLNVTERQAV